MSGIRYWIGLLLGMNGLRIDRPVALVLPWAAVWLLANYTAETVGSDAAVGYMVACWVFYYVGNGILLGTRARGFLIARLGVWRAYLAYELLVGLMFVHIGLAHVVAYRAGAGQLALPSWFTIPAAVVLFAVGFGVKTWATHVVSLDTYYYRDCFLRKPFMEFSAAGPYRVMKNPMYGAGNLHAYAGALWLQSGTGLAFAALCHVSIFVWYRVVEWPFIRRTYLGQT